MAIFWLLAAFFPNPHLHVDPGREGERAVAHDDPLLRLDPDGRLAQHVLQHGGERGQDLGRRQRNVLAGQVGLAASGQGEK